MSEGSEIRQEGRVREEWEGKRRKKKRVKDRGRRGVRGREKWKREEIEGKF